MTDHHRLFLARTGKISELGEALVGGVVTDVGRTLQQKIIRRYRCPRQQALIEFEQPRIAGTAVIAEVRPEVDLHPVYQVQGADGSVKLVIFEPVMPETFFIDPAQVRS